MKWITTLAPLSLALSLGISVANAASDASNTVSFGYAQSTLKIDGEKIGKDNKGFNLKYRHELDQYLALSPLLPIPSKTTVCLEIAMGRERLSIIL